LNGKTWTVFTRVCKTNANPNSSRIFEGDWDWWFPIRAGGRETYEFLLIEKIHQALECKK
jgi:hypothetical protein